MPGGPYGTNIRINFVAPEPTFRFLCFFCINLFFQSRFNPTEKKNLYFRICDPLPDWILVLTGEAEIRLTCHEMLDCRMAWKTKNNQNEKNVKLFFSLSTWFVSKGGLFPNKVLVRWRCCCCCCCFFCCLSHCFSRRNSCCCCHCCCHHRWCCYCCCCCRRRNSCCHCNCCFLVIVIVDVALDVVVAAVAAFILYFVKGEGIDTIRNLPREPKLYVLEKTWTMIKQAPNWLQWMAI